MTRKTTLTKNSPISPSPIPSRASFLLTIGLGEERDYFVENLSLLLAAGIDVITALNAIKQGIKSTRLKKIITGTATAITNGDSLATALERTNILSAHIIALIRIGEKSGRLSQNLAVISNQYKKDRTFRSKIRAAMMYPVFVLTLAFTIGIGIAWFILPKLARIFETLTIQLPLATKILISLGNFLETYGNIFIPALCLGMALVIYTLFFVRRTRFIGQYILLHLPGIRDIVRDLELARSGYILGTLLDSGIPVVDALISLRDTATFIRFQKFYAALVQSISEGNSFQKSFLAYPKTALIYPIPIQQMIFSAEQSGKLAHTFLSISQTFEEKTESATKNLATILEPLLLVIVWIAVMLVALAVVLPIYSLIGNLNT